MWPLIKFIPRSYYLLFGLILGFLVGEYKGCPSSEYSLDFGCQGVSSKKLSGDFSPVRFLPTTVTGNGGTK